MITINGITKIIHGTSASRRLRSGNMFPAIIYGGNYPPIFIILDHNIIIKLEDQRKFFTETLLIIVNNKENYVKVKEVQHHPFKSKIIHIDFIRVEL
ncbi:MAG: 50S ribosomal protein L25 [Candidatus Dasytiphilus stammeri]